ncbi:MAG: Hsp20/alpha crystallin family protein [Fibrobacter sp.]|nr:Hsp20/alpha crystallin family protein [Fibrobacter sp.]
MVCTYRPLSSVNFLRNSLDTLLNNQNIRYAYPLVNAYDSVDAITIVAKVPGVSKDSISILFENGTLTIKGTKNKVNYTDSDKILLNERTNGNFEKSFTIPVKINDSAISATLVNGVLTIVLPKSDEVKPKTITIS